jgi:hypothetical protein
MASEAADPQDVAPAVSPTAANPSCARRLNLQMTANGVVACYETRHCEFAPAFGRP